MERVVVVNRVVVDARRGLARHYDLWRRLHHALIEFLHLIESGRGGCQVIDLSIVRAIVLGCVDTQSGAFFERSGFILLATRLD